MTKKNDQKNIYFVEKVEFKEMGEELKDNPFAALFSSVEQAQSFTETRQLQRDELISEDPARQPPDSSGAIKLSLDNTNTSGCAISRKSDVNLVIEDIFLITLDKEYAWTPGRPPHCVFLEDMYTAIDCQSWLDELCVEQAVFERIMCPVTKNDLVHCATGSTLQRRDNSDDGGASETKVLHYLYQCYVRWQAAKNKLKDEFVDLLNKCCTVIINNGQMLLSNPEILADGQDKLDVQIYDLLTDYYSDDSLRPFFNKIVEAIEIAHRNDNESAVNVVFAPLLGHIEQRLKKISLMDPALFHCLNVLHFFSFRPSLAMAFVEHCMPQNAEDGLSFQETLLGSILSVSSIPKSDQRPTEFYLDPGKLSQAEHDNIERTLWMPLGRIPTEIHKLLNAMVRLSADVRGKVLAWIGSCIYANRGRAKLWHNYANTGINSRHASDGFFLNLSHVLLRFCQPLVAVPFSPKLALVDPTYCAATFRTDEERIKCGVHLKGMSDETSLVPREENEEDYCPSEPPKFATECFFMAHRSLLLGFHTTHEQIVKLMTELRRVQRLHSEASEQGGADSDVAQNMKSTIEKWSSRYFCSKTHLSEPVGLQMMLEFYLATAVYLSNVAANSNPSVFSPVTFPLSDDVPSAVACLPEFVVDNVSDFVSFLRRFSPSNLEMAGESLQHLMTMILVFMGDQRRMKNPHLRAKLAEAMECLMPHREDNPNMAIVSMYNREQLFTNHPHADQIGPTLLHVFVSIEMTGHSVAFEQKFNYRRPMYEIIAYIWKLDVHLASIQRLAKEAEEKIESADPPLFLRFINLLINDAIYLLDEGLMHMSNIRETQNRMTTDEYQQMPAERRREIESTFNHSGMLARFHNVMGKQTIHTLNLLTSKIVSIFVHPTMVERVALMLNYFLLHLVGPKSKMLKVKDMDEYEFKPKDIVTGICNIYINLRKSDAFLAAVATDGRSYSHNLFVKAEETLWKINQGGIVQKFKAVADKIKSVAAEAKIQEDSLADAPEEFLDEIMGTLMRDPVILPSSNVIVDRSTIARHLLSDQTDPFNRSPLTMDMVQPATDLKNKIDSWRQMHRPVSPSPDEDSKDESDKMIA